MLKVKLIAAGIVCTFGLIFFVALGHGLVGYNDSYSFQIYQPIRGPVQVISSPGYYYKGFGTVWTYPQQTETTLDDLSEIIDGGGGVDAKGNKIITEKKAQVQATEVVNDKDGNPIVIQPSPLIGYGLIIPQFSITAIEYDSKTQEQFAAKKTSYLNAELAKAQRQNEVQQRLMVEERGRRQVADVQAEQNQIKEKATIAAQQEADVAVIKKVEAVTQARQKVEVAEQAKKEAVMRASQTVEVAEQARKEAETLKLAAAIKAERAELDKRAAISAAEAQQKAIELGGGITEKDRVLAEIKAGRDEKVAAALATVKTPSVVIVGGEGEGGTGLTDNLINMRLLQGLGILEPVAK